MWVCARASIPVIFPVDEQSTETASVSRLNSLMCTARAVIECRVKSHRPAETISRKAVTTPPWQVTTCMTKCSRMNLIYYSENRECSPDYTLFTAQRRCQLQTSDTTGFNDFVHICNFIVLKT